MAASDCPSWRHPKVLLVVGSIFFCGSIAGAVAMQYGLHTLLHKPMPYWTEGGKQISVQKFKRELALTEEQAVQIESILDDFVMYYQTLQSQMDEVRASGKDRILGMLDPEQRRKFEKMLGEMQARQIR